MIPLQIAAHLSPLCGSFMAQERSIAFDALLAAQVAQADGRTRLGMGDDMGEPIEIPVAREPGGRFHLASLLLPDGFERRGVRYIQRRFPLEEARRRTRLRQVNLAAGVSKHYRIPRETLVPTDGEMTAYCFGDLDAVRGILALVTHLGSRRAVGSGKLQEARPWTVEPVDPWEGFPVLLDRVPLRPLPLDWPGLDLAQAEIREGRLTYPYWWREGVEELAWPQR